MQGDFLRITDRELLLELRIVGRHMRAAQRKYFKTKSRNDLVAAKALEKRFDDIVERKLEEPTTTPATEPAA